MSKNYVAKDGMVEQRSGFVSSLILYIVLFGLAIVCFLPFYLMIINSTNSSSDIAAKLNLLPGTSFFDNLKVLQEATSSIGRNFFNSFYIAVLSTGIAAYVGSLTAFGLSKYKFKGSKLMFYIVLGTMLLPPQLGMIGLVDICNQIPLFRQFPHLILIVPAFANANMVFFIKLYMDGAIPLSFIEAARIDGCSEFGIFNKIILPLVTPAIATTSIFGFLASWNGYLIPSIVLNNANDYTMPMVTALAKGVYRTNYGAVYVAIAISIVPIMIAFLFCSKYIIGGLTAGGDKG